MIGGVLELLRLGTDRRYLSGDIGIAIGLNCGVDDGLPNDSADNGEDVSLHNIQIGRGQQVHSEERRNPAQER